MQNGIHFEMGVRQGIDGNLVRTLQGRAVGTDMEIQGFDGGGRGIGARYFWHSGNYKL